MCVCVFKRVWGILVSAADCVFVTAFVSWREMSRDTWAKCFYCQAVVNNTRAESGIKRQELVGVNMSRELPAMHVTGLTSLNLDVVGENPFLWRDIRTAVTGDRTVGIFVQTQLWLHVDDGAILWQPSKTWLRLWREGRQPGRVIVVTWHERVTRN